VSELERSVDRWCLFGFLIQSGSNGGNLSLERKNRERLFRQEIYAFCDAVSCFGHSIDRRSIDLDLLIALRREENSGELLGRGEK